VQLPKPLALQGRVRREAANGHPEFEEDRL